MVKRNILITQKLEYHPYVLAHLQPVLDIQAKHGILTEAYGPLTPLLRHPTGGPLKSVLERIAQRISADNEVSNSSPVPLTTHSSHTSPYPSPIRS